MISEGIFLKQLVILILSAVKFLIAAPASYLFGYSYFHTLINTSLGGLLGVVFFFFLSRTLIRLYKRHSFGIINALRQIVGIPALNAEEISRKRSFKKIFTRKNRIIVKIRRSLGLPGIVILTPVLFSIPLGTILALKYYSTKRNLLAWLSLSVIVWAVLLTTFIELL